MKKALLCTVLCVLVVAASGCASLDAVYDDDAKIAKSGDSHSTSGAGSTRIGNTLTVTTATMKGSRTLWRYEPDTESEVTISYSLSVSGDGKAKLVLVAPGGDVTVITQKDAGLDTDGMQTLTVPVEPGSWRIKIVGYGAPKFDLKLSVDVGRLEW